MDDFFDKIIARHKGKMTLPSKVSAAAFIENLMSLLIPGHSQIEIVSKEKLLREFLKNKEQLKFLLLQVDTELTKTVSELIDEFYNTLPEIYQSLLKDAEAIEKGDPAARNIEEVMHSYPGFYAIFIYRIANKLFRQGIPFLPRILSEIAHSKTGIDIHPGATIGESFFIDHGTGIVIGETSIIGNQVKVYQGVTLGALSVKKEMAETKRHPTIEENVVIYAGATILGGNTIIGKNSTIGGNVWITSSIEENTMVYHKPELIIQKK